MSLMDTCTPKRSLEQLRALTCVNSTQGPTPVIAGYSSGGGIALGFTGLCQRTTPSIPEVDSSPK